MRRCAAALAAVVISLGLVVVTAGALVGAGASRALAAPAPPAVRLVVIAAVPDLRWTDAATMPALRTLAGSGAVGLLSDKTVGTSTGCLTGLLAIAAGTRTSGPPGGGVPTCRNQDRGATTAANEDNSYAADVTALGKSLSHAGVRRWIADPRAYDILAGPGTVRLVRRAAAPGEPSGSDPSAAIEAAASSGRPAVAAATDTALLRAPGQGAHRRAARAAVNAWLEQLISATPRSALLMVLGTSDAADGAAHLHVAVLRGPGIGHRALMSGSTDRAPYVQLIDVAPTVLAAFRLPVPAGFTGARMTASSAPAPTLRQAVDLDRHAVVAVPAAEAFRGLLITMASVALALALLGALWPPARPAAVTLARITAPLPLLSWLAQLIPWWRAGATWLVTGLVVVGIAVGLVTTVLRRAGLTPWLELLLIPAATAVLLVTDQLTGGGLQISAVLGDNPLEAGRFTGMGNAAFAVLLGSAVLVAAAAAGWLRAAGRSRAAGLAVALLVLLLAVVVDGAPQVGDDLGGVLAAVPAAAVTLVLLVGWRITRTRLVAIAAAAVVLAAAAAAADYARPAADQTHLGRFVGQLLHGGSATTVHRKLTGILRLQGEIPLALAIMGAVAPTRWWEPLRAWLRRTPGLTAAVAGLLVLMVLGSLFNDSGVAVLGFVIAAAAPSLVAATVPPATGARTALTSREGSPDTARG